MSPLVVAWSMCASACLMLGLMHLLFWFRDRQASAYLLSALMGFSAAASALLELAMLTTESVLLYSELLRWENLAIFMILVPMVWFVYGYFQAGRRWLAITITALWSMGILVNFLLPGNLTFEHVTELKRLTTYWGEPFSLPVGELNPWRLLADLASLLILVYTLDATLQLWRRDRSKRVLIVGGSIVIFILLAGIHTPLVDAGVVATPYMISFSFLAIVFALSYQVVNDAVKASGYEQELQRTRRNLDHYARVNLMGECTTMLAHEINQPLTAILSNAQAARRYLASETPEMDEIHEILDDIVRDDKRASGIIHGLRKMLQKEEIVRQRFDLNEAAREVTCILGSELREKRIELTADYAPALPSVYAGRIEIQQVILNLLVNAARAVEESGNKSRKISLRTRVADAEVRVEVQDSGPGIADELHDSLFNTFISDREDRLGMGLAICQRIIEAYGGRIRADNAAAGGALFVFTLPVGQ